MHAFDRICLGFREKKALLNHKAVACTQWYLYTELCIIYLSVWLAIYIKGIEALRALIRYIQSLYDSLKGHRKVLIPQERILYSPYKNDKIVIS